MEKITRKLDKWIDKNPVLSTILTGVLFLAIAVLFWNLFGDTLKWAYGQYLAKHLDPVIAKHVTPHFAALWDVMREKVPVMEKMKNLFVYRDVNITAGAGAGAAAGKEL